MNRIAFLAALSLVAVGSASAEIVQPTSYDMPNGNGVASGGALNYWDLAYTGTGSTITDNAPLSGGLGDLTDGLITSENWFNIENGAGTGPYVGWANLNPLITFNFASPIVLTRVSIHFDDSDGNGGVEFPASVNISVDGNALAFPLTDDNSAAPSWVDLDIPLFNPVSSFSVTFLAANTWVFADEVQISAIPEPSAASLALAFPAAIVLRRRRR